MKHKFPVIGIVHVFLAAFLSISLGACSMFGHNSGVKEPSYTVLTQEGSYELREYPQIVLVTAAAAGDFDRAQNESFRKLFDYISGKNSARQDIPMTAPVFMESAGRKIDMTAPVLMENRTDGWSMSFVLPAEYTLATAPQPLDSSLKLEERVNIKYAVLKFSGFFSEKNFTTRVNELSAWMDKNSLTPAGGAVRAGYNPPWTLPPLRRNEVLIPVN